MIQISYMYVGASSVGLVRAKTLGIANRILHSEYIVCVVMRRQAISQSTHDNHNIKSLRGMRAHAQFTEFLRRIVF